MNVILNHERKSFRKQIISPLTLYNLYIQTYNKYFSDFYTTTRKKELNNKKIESYFINFAETHFIKLGESLDKMKDFLLWCFAKHSRVAIYNLHSYLEEYLKEEKNNLESFYFKINTYLLKNKIKTWDDYIKGTKNSFPKIIEHYIATKDFPFEFILYLNVLDGLNDSQKKMIKVILRKEMMSFTKKIKFVEQNKDFFKSELDQIGGI